MKKLTLMLIAALLVVALCSCSKFIPGLAKPSEEEKTDTQPEDATETTPNASTDNTENADDSATDTAAPENSSANESTIFDIMPDDFAFASGAGAWSTEFELEDDGTFSGSFHDADAGIRSDEFPNGTVFICNFTGKFSTPTKVNDTTYSTKLEKLDYEGVVNETYVEDGTKYINSEAYGFDNGENFTIYFPGTPLSDMPEEAISWLSAFGNNDNNKILTRYCIYNEAAGLAFYSVDED